MALSDPATPTPTPRDAAYILDRLSHVDLLLALPPEEVQAIVPMMEMVQVTAGETVVSQGDVGTAIYLIESGTARVRRNADTEVATLGPGEVFGEMALVHDVVRSASVTAETPMTLWRLPAADFQRLVETSPRLAAALQEVAEHRRAGQPLPHASRRTWLNAAVRAWIARSFGTAGLRAAEERLSTIIQRKRPARDVNLIHDESLSFGERLADRIAIVMGSWKFIIAQSLLLCVWVVLNASQLLFQAWDPYPFILMNLVLSMQAAYAAPVIMMSQNRQAGKDRLQADLDLRTNLHAEVLIEELHAAMDDLRLRQWQELLEIQERQIELLSQVVKRQDERPD